MNPSTRPGSGSGTPAAAGIAWPGTPAGLRGDERRQQTRYRIPPATAADAPGVRIRLADGNFHHDWQGTLLDVSVSGFCARVRGLVSELPAAPLGCLLDWQIESRLGLLCGRGELRRQQSHGDELLLGLRVDSPASPLTPLVEHLREHWQSGSLSVDRRGLASVHGRLHFATARQIIERPHDVRKIDLTHCTGIDTAGIGLIDLALSRGVTLTGCSHDLRPLLSVSGICGRCQKVSAAQAAPRHQR